MTLCVIGSVDERNLLVGRDNGVIGDFFSSGGYSGHCGAVGDVAALLTVSGANSIVHNLSIAGWLVGQSVSRSVMHR